MWLASLLASFLASTVTFSVLQLQQFPKFPKNFGTLLLIRLVWFSSLIWFNDSSRKIVANTWNDPLWFFMPLNEFQVFESEEYFLTAPSLRKSIQLHLRYFSRCVCFNQLFFHFASEWFVTSVSVVAQGRLLSLLIPVWISGSRFVILAGPVSLGLPPLRLQNALPFSDV